MYSIAMRILCEDEENSLQRAGRRHLRDKSNPLEMPETLFLKYYRVNKDAFKYLLDVLTTSLPPVQQKFSIPPVVKLSACLRFLAEGGYQKGVGKDCEIGLAQSSFSQVLSEVLQIFESVLCPQWIKWPTKEEQRKISQEFYTKFRIPGIVGCVDGTHINIVSPSTNKHLFYNRKGKCSINAMLVCDNDLRIRFVDATHPGACHDSFIWSVSALKLKMERDYLQSPENVWLLGDAGYPLEPWLLTPHRSPEPESRNAKFNETHSKCRNIIERTNGVLKNRWRCLLSARELYYAPKKAIQIINACVSLHNICIHYKSNFDSLNIEIFETDNENNTFEDSQATEGSSGYLAEGRRIRFDITNSF